MAEFKKILKKVVEVLATPFLWLREIFTGNNDIDLHTPYTQDKFLLDPISTTYVTISCPRRDKRQLRTDPYPKPITPPAGRLEITKCRSQRMTIFSSGGCFKGLLNFFTLTDSSQSREKVRLKKTV